MLITDNVLVLIPAYNESGRIGKVIKNTQKYFNNIIIVDDGSIDSTFSEISSCKPSFILKHCVNCGQGTALATGIKYFLDNTNFKYLITLDADEQHMPEDALSMFNYAIDNNSDAVYGSRFLSYESLIEVPKIKRLTISLAKLFERILFGISLSDSHNGLRVLSRKACLNLENLNSSSMANGTEITVKLLDNSIKIDEYPCKILYNKNAKASQSLLSSLNIISDLIQQK